MKIKVNNLELFKSETLILNQKNNNIIEIAQEWMGFNTLIIKLINEVDVSKYKSGDYKFANINEDKNLVLEIPYKLSSTIADDLPIGIFQRKLIHFNYNCQVIDKSELLIFQYNLLFGNDINEKIPQNQE